MRRLEKLLIISQLPPPTNGSTLMTELFLRTLSESGLSFKFIDKNFSQTNSEIGRMSLGKMLKVSVLILRYLKEVIRNPYRKVSILFVTTNAKSFVVDFMTFLLGKMVGQDWILYLHTQSFDNLVKKHWIFEKSVKLLLEKTHTIVVVGESVKETLSNLTRSDKIVVIPNAIAKSALQVNSKPENLTVEESNSEPYFLFLANVNPNKGVHHFVKFASRYLEKDPSMKFHIVGDYGPKWYVEEVCRQIKIEQLEGSIEFLGPLYGREKWDQLRNCICLIQSSSEDAQPLSILEAMSIGVPTIAFDVGGISDIVLSNVTGFLVNYADIEGLVYFALRLASNDDVKRELSTRCRQYFNDHHNTELYTQNWIRVLRKIVSSY